MAHAEKFFHRTKTLLSDGTWLLVGLPTSGEIANAQRIISGVIFPADRSRYINHQAPILPGPEMLSDTLNLSRHDQFADAARQEANRLRLLPEARLDTLVRQQARDVLHRAGQLPRS